MTDKPHWLDIVGVPEAGTDALGADMHALLRKAETIIGVPRRLAGIADTKDKTLIAWDGKLDEMVERILAARKTRTVLLASGDPNWFGIGATLARHLSKEEFGLHPVPSSFQLAAARLHWPMQHLATLSLHGRPVTTLHPHVLPGNRILALTSNEKTPAEVGALLVARGYGASQLTVLEDLGGPGEQVSSFTARDAAGREVGPFHVLAIDCAADADAPLLPPVPGLPDSAFVSDGQLTKREVRALTLARLAPYPGALLWDVGAGSGSVAIEWMRAARNAEAICFERAPQRCEMIAANKQALGTPALAVVAGELPATLAGQPAPGAIFHGGDVGNQPLFDALWQALRPGGRLVANAVTLDGESALLERRKRFGGELTRIAVSVLDTVGNEDVLRPRMTVTQWAVTKPEQKR